MADEYNDDECTILDADPDNPTAVVNDSADGEDELFIIAEKGQLACRDYPHSRHLCAKLPFGSTLHNKYCDMCHCYVCDSPAPCSYWGTGVSATDHCHSTNKEEIWQMKRKLLKQGTQAQKLPVTTTAVTHSLPDQALAVNQMQLPNTGSVTQSVSSPTLCDYPSTTSFGVPRSNREPGFTLSRSRCAQNLNRPQLMLDTNDLIWKERNHNVGTLGPQYCKQLFKRVAYVPTVLPTNQNGCGSSYSRNRNISRPSKNKHPVVQAPATARNQHPVHSLGLPVGLDFIPLESESSLEIAIDSMLYEMDFIPLESATSLEHESSSEIANDLDLYKLDFIPLDSEPLEADMTYYHIESSWNVLAHV